MLTGKVRPRRLVRYLLRTLQKYDDFVFPDPCLDLQSPPDPTVLEVAINVMLQQVNFVERRTVSRTIHAVE